MKILLYHWASYYENDIQSILDEEGVSYEIISWKFQDKNCDDAFLDYVKKNINLSHFDLLFSINYWPLLSNICQQANIPYVSWSYDNPLNVRDIERTLGNEANRVYLFDRVQAEGYRRQGFQTVFHLPLGVNSRRLSKISAKDTRCIPYRTQVSFIGNLYESAIDQLMAGTDDYCRGYLHALMEAQRDVYGAYFIEQSITDDFMEKMNSNYKKRVPDTAFVLKRAELLYALSCEITRRDRIVLLSLLGTRFQTKFYSYNASSLIKGVEKCPPVDYWKEMPYIFAASKINLNPTLRAIQTGIPLRALDIMACGGFLLSNYQAELAELYQHGTEMVLYENLPDALEKAYYYLKHENERAEIALKGREKTLREHDMRDKLAYMFQIIKE